MDCIRKAFSLENGMQRSNQQIHINNKKTVNTIAPKLLFAYVPITLLFITLLSAPRLLVHPLRKSRSVHIQENMYYKEQEQKRM